MNVFKKFMSAAIASATLLAGTAFPASADYDAYDVDRDGSFSMADVVYVTKYLLGAYSISNYNQLDVNRSLTVDEADRECIISKALGSSCNSGYFSRKTGNVVSSPTVSGFTPSNSSSSLAERTYKRCHYENGQPTALSDYTLTPASMSLNDGTSSRKVFGEDERDLAYGPENDGLVYLSINGNGMATGFIVGDHQIATAAHCVYGSGKWYSMEIKTYDSNGCITNNTLHPVEAHIPKSYTSSDDDMYDYALITVSDDLSDHVHFSLGTPYNVSASAYSNVPIYVTGVPGDKANESGKHLYSAEGKIMDKNSNLETYCTDIVCYDVDTAGGESGSPVYTITKIGDKYVYTAIAIHSGGFESYGRNWGSMITHYQLQFYNNNPNASYSAN